MIVRSRFKEVYCVVSVFLVMVWIGFLRDLNLQQWGDIIRAFVFVSIGGAICLFSSWVKEQNCKKTLLLLIEIICLGSSLAMLLFAELDYKLLVLLFFFGLVASFSRIPRDESRVIGKICVNLGSCSLPIYIFHYPIGIFISRITLISSKYKGAMFYILLTFVVIVCSLLQYLKDKKKVV